MHNNYNHYTTNNFDTNGIAVSTQLVRYDKPLYAVIGCGIAEVHGMIIAVTASRDGKGSETLNTYRIPLMGRELEPCEPRSMDDELFILPEDKSVKNYTFKTYLNQLVPTNECSVEEAVEELQRYKFVPFIQDEGIVVEVCDYDNEIRAVSSWFDLPLKKEGKDWLKPSNLVGLCAIMKYLDKPMKFVPFHGDNEVESKLAAELARLVDAFSKYGFCKAKTRNVENDGIYTYSRELGKIEMSREEFIRKFPDGVYSMIEP